MYPSSNFTSFTERGLMIKYTQKILSVLAMSMLIHISAAQADVCAVGQQKNLHNAVIADALSEQCWTGCEVRTDEQIFQAPEGWAIVNYETGTRHDRGRTTRSVQVIAKNGHFASSQAFESLRRSAGSAKAVDPNTGQPIEVGGSIEAQAIERMNRQYSASHTTIVLKVTAQGREFRGGSSKREEALHVNIVCVGTLDGYREAIQKELQAAKR